MTIPVDHPHSQAELRSLAMHRVIAERLLHDPSVLEHALAMVRCWGQGDGPDPRYVERWRGVLSQPVERIVDVLLADDENGRDLRQVSPFAGVLDPRERWQILQAFTSVAVSRP